MNVAFVQHSEHDVNRHERRQNQPRLVRQRRLKCLSCPLEACANTGRQSDLAFRSLNRLYCVSERRTWSKIERQRHRGELPLVVHSQRRSTRFKARE